MLKGFSSRAGAGGQAAEIHQVVSLSPVDKLETRPSADSAEGSFPVPIQNPASVPCLDNSGSPP